MSKWPPHPYGPDRHKLYPRPKRVWPRVVGASLVTGIVCTIGASLYTGDKWYRQSMADSELACFERKRREAVEFFNYNLAFNTAALNLVHADGFLPDTQVCTVKGFQSRFRALRAWRAPG